MRQRFAGLPPRDRVERLSEWLKEHRTHPDVPLYEELLAELRLLLPLELFDDDERDGIRSGAISVDGDDATREPLVVAFHGPELRLYRLRPGQADRVRVYTSLFVLGMGQVEVQDVHANGPGRFLVVVNDGRVLEYAVDGDRPSREIAPPQRTVQVSARSPDGRRLALGASAWSGAPAAVEVVDLEGGRPWRLGGLEVDRQVHALAFSADGAALAVATSRGDGSAGGVSELLVWSLDAPDQPARAASLGATPTAVARAPGGAWYVGMVEGLFSRVDDAGPVPLLSGQEALPLQAMTDPSAIAHSSDVTAILPVGEGLLLTASSAGGKPDRTNQRWNELRAWRLEGDRVTEVLLDDGRVRRGRRPYVTLRMTTGGTHLLAGTSRGVVEVWPMPRW